MPDSAHALRAAELLEGCRSAERAVASAERVAIAAELAAAAAQQVAVAAERRAGGALAALQTANTRYRLHTEDPTFRPADDTA
jgi:hypothetical protein